MTEDIEEIREDAIKEIKEKARNNPKILSPFNKERLEYQKKLKFANGNEFTCWMQQVGIMKNSADIERENWNKKFENARCKTWKEYQDKCARNIGFKDDAERQREWAHETGKNLPREFNEDCSSWFGDFTENLMIQTFEDAIKMPPNNPGFDWSCKRGDKIDNKCRCLDHAEYGSPRWAFPIRWNNIADWFILSAWDNRDILNPLHVWIFNKNDMVRGRKFWRRDTFSITNTPDALKKFEKYEVTNRLDRLKELCNKERE